MKYEKIVRASFVERDNRFVARVKFWHSDNIDKENAEQESADLEVSVHVKNTGRCKELLLPGATVYLEDFAGRMRSRKMRYSLLAVEKETDSGTVLINMDSQAPNRVVQEALESGYLRLPGMEELSLIKPEQKFGNSRFDFYLEGTADEEAYTGVHGSRAKAFAEVKGVTLEEKGFAEFPDAPTQRGLKHVEELCSAVEAGYKAYIIFVIQMKKVNSFGPNYKTHPQFGEALKAAISKGVQVLVFDCNVSPDSLSLGEPVALRVEGP